MYRDSKWRARSGALATLASALALIAGATVADAKERDKKKGKDEEAAEAPAFAAIKPGEPVYPCLLYTSPSPRDRG